MRVWTAMVGLCGLVMMACSGAGSTAVPGGDGGAAGEPGGGEGGAAGDPAGGAGGDPAGGAAGKGGGSPIDTTHNVVPDPVTCEEAANSQTYVGCDFWPTVVDNIVRSDFDYAVVVANTSDAEASVTVTRGDQQVATAKVAGNSLTKIYLPWVPELKSTWMIPGVPENGCGTSNKTETVFAKGGAYHLVSSHPVAVYQFNAIEYAGKGGPPGKDWSTCQTRNCFGAVACFSYTNDASLLLPVGALTGTYRIAGLPSWVNKDPSGDPGKSTGYPPYFAVTGTADNTMVQVQLSDTASIAGGSGLPSVAPGGTASFVINKGDVVEVIGGDNSDFSGTLVRASATIQVITGMACTQNPDGVAACDHIEETVLPVETLGKHYFVTRPTGPKNAPVGHVVKIYGNVDGTALSYPGTNPGGPSTINAGQVVSLDVVNDDFEIVGDHEFTVATFQAGGQQVDPGTGLLDGKQKGDPSQSFATTVEQYRLKYVFLAPDDYDLSFADVVQPLGAQLTLDGAPVTVAPVPISSDYGVTRLPLGVGSAGAHVLVSDKPVGLQVLGYGSYTSYQYPGGLNLGHIAPPPIK
jgi:hypothetical protein